MGDARRAGVGGFFIAFIAVKRAERSPRAGPYFFEEIGKKNTKGKEVPSPWNPILWWEEWGR